MHISHDAAPQTCGPASIQQQCTERSPGAAREKSQEVSSGPCPLRLERQACRQDGVALAHRRITERTESAETERSSGIGEPLPVLTQGRATQQPPAGEQSMRNVDTIAHVILSHMGANRLPSAEERAALCSFLHTLDEEVGPTDPLLALAQQQDSHGHSLLYLAVRKSMTGLLEWLLDRQPASGSATGLFTGSNDEQTGPLHLAAKMGDESLVHLLLEKNADVNLQDMYGLTALHLATQSGNGNIVRLLLERKACIDLRTDLGRTPLHWAILHGDLGIVTLLVDAGSDVNAVDAVKYYPLHCAIARRDDVDMIALLLDRGAKVNVTDDLGRTPLYLAVECARKNTVRLLLNNGADINLRHGLAGTPLHTAIRNGDQDMVCFLLQNGADINTRNGDGESPLYWAIARDKGDMACVLLDNNADVNCRNNSGKTALHMAVEKGNEAVIRLLLQKKADANAQDHSGRSPLSWAMNKGDQSLIEQLRGQEGGPKS